MNIKLPKIINYTPFNMDELINKLQKYEDEIKKGSDNKPSTYKEDVEFFRETWIKRKTIRELSLRQIRSVSIYLLENENDIKILINENTIIKLIHLIAASGSISSFRRIVKLFLDIIIL